MYDCCFYSKEQAIYFFSSTNNNLRSIFSKQLCHKKPSQNKTTSSLSIAFFMVQFL